MKLLEGESGEIDFGDPNTRIFITDALKLSILKCIDFEIGYFRGDQDFKELLLLAMLSHLIGEPAKDINLDDYPLEQRQDTIRARDPSRWNYFTRHMARIFPKFVGEDFFEKVGSLNSFRKALFIVLLKQGLSDLLP